MLEVLVTSGTKEKKKSMENMSVEKTWKTCLYEQGVYKVQGRIDNVMEQGCVYVHTHNQIPYFTSWFRQNVLEVET